MFFPTLYVLAKLVTRVPVIKPEDMDFVSGLDEIEALTCVLRSVSELV
jgi:amino acid transporter